MTRLECIGGPFDGRLAAGRPTGTRAYIDSAGRVHAHWGPGRTAYRSVKRDGWVVEHPNVWRCLCGSWIAPLAGGKVDECPLCGTHRTAIGQIA